MDKVKKEKPQCSSILLSTGQQKLDLRADNICTRIVNNNSVPLEAIVKVFKLDNNLRELYDQRMLKVPARCIAREIFVTKNMINYEVEVELPVGLLTGIEVVVAMQTFISPSPVQGV